MGHVKCVKGEIKTGEMGYVKLRNRLWIMKVTECIRNTKEERQNVTGEMWQRKDMKYQIGHVTYGM